MGQRAGEVGSGVGLVAGEQGYRARDLRGRERRAAVRVVAAVQVGGGHVDAGGDQIGVARGSPAAGGGAAGAHRVDDVGVGRDPDRHRFGVVGRAHAARGGRAAVAGGEHRHDAGGAQRLHIGLELEIASNRPERPRVVDDARSVGGGRVVVGVEHPLQRLVDRGCRGSAGVVEHPGGDPLGARRDADRGPRRCAGHHHTGGRRAVSVEVGRGGLLVVRVEPRVRAAAVARRQIGVGHVDAGVEVGDDYALPGVAEVPQRGRLGQLHVGRGSGRRCQGRHASRDDDDVVRGDEVDVRARGDRRDDRRGGGDRDRVVDPQRRERGDAALGLEQVQQGDHQGLREALLVAQIGDDAMEPLAERAGAPGANIDAVAQPHDDRDHLGGRRRSELLLQRR